MLVSRKLIEDYIDLKHISDEEIARRLTFAGVEVETFHSLAKGSNLVVGQIKEAVKIEGSDHLQKTLVDIGTETLQIVCGGKNARVGLKVIVAKIGAVLPEITIKKSVIKGVESNGMLCALNELGVDESYIPESFKDGIHELPDEAIVGDENVLEILDLDDTIFEIRPLANRPDMHSIYNIVRELSALFEVPYEIPDASFSRHKKTKLTLNVTSPLVTRFTLTEVDEIHVSASPQWLQTVLLKHGFRPVNNIVDIGNYVMLLTGRPLHMYDLDRVKDEAFAVVSDENITFTALDEKEYNLMNGDQIIRDANGVLCLGGVMGSFASSVTNTTKRIAIEVALFDRSAIRLSATRLNLPSEASSRFSKGVNVHNEEEALNLALLLILDLLPDVTISNTVTYAAEAKEVLPIKLDYEQINRILGTEFSDIQIKSVLERLGFVVSSNLEVTVPHYRQEIYGSADLAEEVIRVLGFDHIKTELPVSSETLGELDDTQLLRLDVRTLLRRHGYYETLNYTLVNEKELKSFVSLNAAQALSLDHPMTPERAYLRLHLLPSLMATLNYNVSRQQSDLKLFELSSVYSELGSREHLAFILSGNDSKRGLLEKRAYDFYDIKGVSELLLDYLGIKEGRFEFVENTLNTADFHPSQSALLRVAGQVVGILGRVHPLVEKEYGISSNTFAAELDFGYLSKLKTGNGRVKAPSRFPLVERDLAFIVAENVKVGDMEKTIKQLGGKLVLDVRVFDVYTKLHNLPNHKSVAFSLRFLDREKTLVDEEVSAIIAKIISGVESKFSAEVRKG